MSKDFEQRCVSTGFTIEERAEGDTKMTIAGYAATFNNLSSDLGGFREQLSPGAFDAVMEDDVRAVFNHDPNGILGRSSSGTLRMSLDGTGLKYEVDLPDNTLGRDLYASVQRGDIKESSFRFSIAPNGEEWKDTDEGMVRTITKVSRLVDVSPVTYPAYPDATIAARSLDGWKKEHDLTDVHSKICALKRIQLESL